MDAGFDFEAPDLRALLDEIRRLEPRLATDLRRELRRAGDDVIADQRRILAGAKPGRIEKTGEEYRWVRPKNGGKPYLARRVVYDKAADTAGGGELRARIAAGLRTQVSTGKTRQGVSIKTTGPRLGGANMAIVWDQKVFRHPVFGDRQHWVYQQGRPFFWSPLQQRFVAVRQRVFDVISDALDRLAKKG